MKLSYRRGTNILGIVSALGGLVIIALAIIQQLPFLRKELPGSGFFPILCGIAITILGGLIIIENEYRAMRAKENVSVNKEMESNLIDMVELRNFAYTIGVSVLVIIMTPFIGLVVSIGIAVAILIRFLGRESIIKSVLIGFIVAMILFLIFEVLLGVPLPTSIIGI